MRSFPGIPFGLVVGVLLGWMMAQTGTGVPADRASNPQFPLSRLKAEENQGLSPVRMTPCPNNPLWVYFDRYTRGPVVHKWVQYFDVYHRYFGKHVGRNVTLLEIGVQSGGSIGMWQNYFGPGLVYYGVDINPYTKVLFDQPPLVNIFIGSQSNRTFWKSILPLLPHVDIVIDDGGHTMDQQITTFEELYGHLKADGTYMVEDCSTSYWKGYGGVYRQNTSWIDYAKSLVDHINADYAGEAGIQPSWVTRSTMAIAFYDQMVVFEKGDHSHYIDPPAKGSMSMPTMPNLTVDGQVDPETCRSLAAIYEKSAHLCPQR
jgi:hypothetical protein